MSLCRCGRISSLNFDSVTYRSEIADKNFSGGTDAKSQKPFPRFLIKLSELMPRLIHKQMVVLQKHLDSEVYKPFFVEGPR